MLVRSYAAQNFYRRQRCERRTKVTALAFYAITMTVLTICFICQF